MGHERYSRANDDSHSYDKYRIVFLPGHDKSDKITFAKLGRDNIYVLTESGRCYMSGWNHQGQCPTEFPPPSTASAAVRNSDNIMREVHHNVPFKKVVGNLAHNHNTLFIDDNDVLWGCGFNAGGYFFGQNKGHTRSWHDQASGQSSYWPANKYNNSKQLINIMSGVQDVHISGIYYTTISTNHYYPHSVFVLKTNGQVWACGYNSHSQLGDGTTTARDEYEQIGSGTIGAITKLKISSGTEAVSVYALNTAGQLWVWGYNGYGQLGLGHNANQTTPVLSRSNVQDFWVSSGNHSTQAYVLGTDDNLYVTGRNTNGNLGLGDTTDRNSWTLLNIGSGLDAGAFYPGAQSITDICMNENHCTWILYQDSNGKGKVLSCGYNGYGQLGFGDKINRTTFDVLTHAPEDIKEIWTTSYTNIAYGSLHVKDSNSKLWVCGYANYYIHDRDNRNKHVLTKVKL